MRKGYFVYRALLISIALILTAGCSSSEITPEVECDNNAVREIRCGVKNNGLQKQLCVDYQWADDGECDDPTECLGSEVRTGFAPCGLNDRGELREQCDRGVWTSVDNISGHDCSTDDDPQQCACIDPDECVDDDTAMEACGFEDSGERALLCVSGTWSVDSACEGGYECVASNTKVEEKSCGLNDRGKQF